MQLLQLVAARVLVEMRSGAMKTVAEWLKKYPGVNILAFERNASKSSGFGTSEEVCGFCLASHYFDGTQPERCKFCRAPLRKSHVISETREITGRTFTVVDLFPEGRPKCFRLFVVPKH
jgi:hypothetical protein